MSNVLIFCALEWNNVARVMLLCFTPRFFLFVISIIFARFSILLFWCSLGPQTGVQRYGGKQILQTNQAHPDGAHVDARVSRYVSKCRCLIMFTWLYLWKVPTDATMMRKVWLVVVLCFVAHYFYFFCLPGWSLARGVYNSWTYHTVESTLPPTRECF